MMKIAVVTDEVTSQCQLFPAIHLVHVEQQEQLNVSLPEAGNYHTLCDLFWKIVE